MRFEVLVGHEKTEGVRGPVKEHAAALQFPDHAGIHKLPVLFENRAGLGALPSHAVVPALHGVIDLLDRPTGSQFEEPVAAVVDPVTKGRCDTSRNGVQTDGGQARDNLRIARIVLRVEEPASNPLEQVIDAVDRPPGVLAADDDSGTPAPEYPQGVSIVPGRRRRKKVAVGRGQVRPKPNHDRPDPVAAGRHGQISSR